MKTAVRFLFMFINIISPYPPLPIDAVSIAIPFASINANFNPANIAGYAFGILTFIKICQLVRPKP